MVVLEEWIYRKTIDISVQWIVSKGAVMGYYVGHLSWDAYTDRIAPTTLEQSFIDWYESVKAVPVAQ